MVEEAEAAPLLSVNNSRCLSPVATAVFLPFSSSHGEIHFNSLIVAISFTSIHCKSPYHSSFHFSLNRVGWVTTI